MRRAALRLLVALVAATPLAGCDQADADVTLRFDRDNADPAFHPFPSDLYLRDGLLAGFTEDQVAALPFLVQLPLAFRTGWWEGTSLRIPFTPARRERDRWIDPATVADALRLYRLDEGLATPVPLAEVRVWRDTNSVTARPAAPVEPGRYGLAVLDGRIRTLGGGRARPSVDYSLVRRRGDPATDAGFGLVAAADPDVDSRRDTLAYVELTVVDGTAQARLLAAYVEGKAVVDRAGADETLDVTPFLPPETREIAGGGQLVAGTPEGVAAVFASFCDGRCGTCEGAADPAGCEATLAACLEGCAQLPRAGIGRIAAGLVSTPSFVSDPVPDTAALFRNGTFLGRNPALPFQPENPLSLSGAAPFRTVPYLAFFPATPAADPPPVVVAIHGFSLSKESFFPLASALCSGGLAVIAIDNYQHGARQDAIEVPEGDFADKLDPVLLAGGVAFPDPFLNPTFLARTRDKIRQSLVDQLSLVRLVAAADGTAPVDLDGDAAPDAYGPVMLVGQSLGAILGTSVAALSPHVARAVLNVPGGDMPAIVRDSLTFAPDLDLLAYATAAAAGFGLMAGAGEAFLPLSDPREVYNVVASTVVGPVDALTTAPFVLDGGLGGAAPRVLVQLASEDTVIPPEAGLRFVRALAAGAAAPEDLPVWSDGALNQDWLSAGLPVRDVLSQGPTASGVTQFVGDHGLLLDFANPQVTAAAQLQVVQFLLAP